MKYVGFVMSVFYLYDFACPYQLPETICIGNTICNTTKYEYECYTQMLATFANLRLQPADEAATAGNHTNNYDPHILSKIAHSFNTQTHRHPLRF